MIPLSILFTLSLFLVSCSSTQWVKPGATEADLGADTVSCNNDIINSSIGARAIQGMGASTARGRSAVSAGTSADAAKAREECLLKKGWTRPNKP